MKSSGARIIALGLVAIGILVIGGTVRVPAPTIGDVPVGDPFVPLINAPFVQIWPAFLSLIGVALLAQNGSERRTRLGLTFTGTLLLVVGVFLLLFTFRVARLTWSDMARLWPILLILLGFSFVMVYIASDFRDRAMLVPAYLLGGIGVFALPFTLGTVQTLAFRQALRLWPLVIIAIVLGFIFRQTPETE